MATLLIRDMLPEDIDGKGTVHYQSWQESYRGIVDDGYLEWLSEDKCQEIAHRWPGNTAVAALDGKVVGFGCWYPCQNDPTAAELSALYVLEEYKGRGLGRMLADYCLEKVSEYKKVILWVLEENHRAISFYEHYGFAKTGEKIMMKLGTPVSCICMAKNI